MTKEQIDQLAKALVPPKPIKVPDTSIAHRDLMPIPDSQPGFKAVPTSMDKIQRPSPGRIVHYLSIDGEHWPAIITDVGDGSCIGIWVFKPYDQTYYPCISHDPSATQPATWHWPEYVVW